MRAAGQSARRNPSWPAGATWETGKTIGQQAPNGKGTNADGSTFKFHANGHIVFDAAGVPKLEFFKAHCR